MVYIFVRNNVVATITRFEDLKIWQLARVLASRIFQLYTLSPEFSKDYKLKDQINGSSGSVMDNIAEGFGRGSKNEFINFLSYSIGSAEEVKSQLYRGFDRKYYEKAVFDEVYELTEKVRNKTGNLIKYLNKSTYTGIKFKNRNTTEKRKETNSPPTDKPSANNPTTNDNRPTTNNTELTTNPLTTNDKQENDKQQTTNIISYE
jgi:four helix bundle protein